LPGKTWKTFIIAAEGDKASQLTQRDCPEVDANWSPDGTHLVFGTFLNYAAGTSCPVVLHTMDLKNLEVSTIPGSEGLWSPRWSPDGQRIVAQTSALGGSSLMIYEFPSRKWAELVRATPGHSLGFQQWSRDSKWVYYRDFGSNPGVYSIRLEDHKIEKIVDLTGIPTTGNNYEWSAVDPDGNPLILRAIGALNEIYALDFEAP
jgi:Tol biopolymer transport system component